MQIDRTKINLMPLIRGPLWDQKDLPRHVYASVESLMLQYETEPDAIPPLLPEPFKPGKSPINAAQPHMQATRLRRRVRVAVLGKAVWASRVGGQRRLAPDVLVRRLAALEGEGRRRGRDG